MNQNTQDYLEALEQEISCVDDAIELMFQRRRQLFDLREKALAECNSDTKRAGNS
jgi:hypothetical protein